MKQTAVKQLQERLSSLLMYIPVEKHRQIADAFQEAWGLERKQILDTAYEVLKDILAFENPTDENLIDYAETYYKNKYEK